VRRTRSDVTLLAGTLAVATALVLTGCSGATVDPATSATPPASDPALDGSITVYAAASLTTTFTELADEFEKAHPGTTVELTFAGSSDLVTQITEGAPADVVASADEKNMAKLTDAGLVDPSAPEDFATNVLTIAVPSSNPAGVTDFADLAKTGVKTVICAAQVPCGAATATVEKATGVTISPVSEESSVTDVLGKVTSGEADAGLVYVTDVEAAGDSVQGIDFPEADQAVTTYPIAPVADTANPAVAEAFVAFVTGEVGQGVLQDAGFGTP
jgi:molybdate transport system substrate-binding protein